LLKRNLIANYLGQGWTALMGLVFIPTYIQYLGIEAYGLIGLFSILLAWLALLDMGMTPALSREMALFTGGAESAVFIRDMLRSIEIITFGLAFFLIFNIWLASDWLASDWLLPDKLSLKDVAQAISIMGFVAALRLFEGVYRSAIIGLQRQVLFNIVSSILATLRGFGAVGVLIWIGPTIKAFFIWQALISILSLGVFSMVTYRSIPRIKRDARFSVSTLRRIRGFALGMMGVTFLSLLLMQTDKLILSRFLTLSEFGYYTLAATLAGALYMVVSPIGQAWLPKLTELHAELLQINVIEKFHQGAQLVSVLMGSAALIVIVFSEIILEIWTHNEHLVQSSAYLLSLLALGNLLNGLMWIPYQTQLAYGWTALAAYINLVSVIVIIPALLFVIPRHGAEGAAWVWISLNASYILVGIPLMFRKILITEKWKWYKEDVFKPLSVAIMVAVFFRIIMPANFSYSYKIVWLVGVSGITLLASSFAAHYVRASILKIIRTYLGKKVKFK
jgi:O-antigen/teichoic acid export membrane protein